MTESKRSFHFKEARELPSLKMGDIVMRCSFIRGGHVAGFEELSELSDQDATAKAHALFSERAHLFEGFELWDRARVVTRYPEPAASNSVDLGPPRWP
jgi:hypothetical protein